MGKITDVITVNEKKGGDANSPPLVGFCCFILSLICAYVQVTCNDTQHFKPRLRKRPSDPYGRRDPFKVDAIV